MKRSRLTTLLAVGVMGIRCDLFAQNSPFRLQVEVSLIALDVAAYDSSSNPVSKLTIDDFLVFEDGIPQTIQHFEPMDAAYNSLLLFDVSGSTESQLPFMIQASNRFLNNLRAQDQAAVASFDSVVTKLMDWRTRGGMSGLVTVPFRRGGTDLYTALLWAAGELRPMSGRKGVIVLTDGLDYRLFAGQPPAKEEQDFQNLLKAVEQSRSPFYFVALAPTNNPSVGFDSPPRKAVQRMEALSERSGGRVLFPRTIQDVASLYEGIARGLSASYSLAYGSTRPQKDGTYRRIEVRLKNSELRVSQSRTGYYADGPKPHDKPVHQSVSSPSSTVNTPKAAGQAPDLVTPIDHALLSSPGKSEWRFIWEEVPQATKYEISIHAPNVDVPVLKAETRGTRYVVGRAFRSAGFSANGWSWQVRAQSANGAWSPWSETRPFDVFRQ